MSRYLLLFILNLPFVFLGFLSALTQYKLGRSSRQRFVAVALFWGLILLMLAFAEPLYAWLFTNNLTASEPLSIFDVFQITAIVVVFYIANRALVKVSTLEKRLQDVHQEVSIQLSKEHCD